AGRLDGLPADRTAGEAPTAGEEAAPRGARLDVSRLVVAEPEGSRAVLRSVGFSVGPGETVVVAGPSGAGKSMLARSLAGAEPAKSGEVRLDRIDIAALDAGALAERVGWLPQDATLFAGSVLDNVTRFGRLSAEEAFAAARTYGLAGLIERLPRGVHTEVGQGGRALPPGARQAVGLWRALAGRRRLVVLDQPSAQMDAEGEVAVLNALRRRKAEGVTAVVISHKPVIATLADRIMVLGDGTIEVFEERATVLDAMRRQSLRPVGERTAEVSA
ncbi:MAG: ATP-binding cassette domain-containing protein, partial [Paracoccaceae bacterium]